MRNLLKQCLDALKSAISSHGRILTSNPPQDAWTFNNVDQRCNDAINALETELAKPINEFNPDWDQQKVLVERIRELEKELAKPEQEPVAWDGECVAGHCKFPNGCDSDDCCRLDTPPRKKWVGLTDEEMKKTCYETWSYDPYEIARAIEAKLKDKNT